MTSLEQMKRKLQGWYQRYLIFWLVPIVMLILWELGTRTGIIPARLLPGPIAVAGAAIKLITTGVLIENIAISTMRALIGLLIGGGLGFFLGLLNGLFSTSEKLLDSTLQMVRTIPNLALLPLVILWFGIGEPARIFLISLGVFFPIYLNTFHGIRQIDKGLIEMGKVYGLTPWGLFRQVIFPGALPSILVGLRFSLGIMWLTLIVAETIASKSGIGYMTSTAREFMQTDIMLFALVLYALLGKLADVIARLLERRLLRWHPAYQK